MRFYNRLPFDMKVSVPVKELLFFGQFRSLDFRGAQTRPSFRPDSNASPFWGSILATRSGKYSTR